LRKILTGLLIFLAIAVFLRCGSEFGVFFDGDSGEPGGYRVFWAEASGELKKPAPTVFMKPYLRFQERPWTGPLRAEGKDILDQRIPEPPIR
jgi:hypothetical protein